METTGIMLLASAALTGIALIIWNRIMSKETTGQLPGSEPQERSRHLNPVFSKMKEHVQGNI